MTEPLDPSQLPSRRALREAEAKRGTRRAPKQAPPDAPERPGGIAAVIARHPKAWLASALGVAFLLLGTGAIFAGIAAGAPSQATPAPSPSASLPDPRTQPSALPAAAAVRTCSVTAYADDGRLGTLAGSVVNAATGEVLYDRDAGAGLPTASVMQILTAAALISTMGPDARLTTKVVAGSSPGTIVLVGGGDPTLATTGDTLYEGAPLLADLAAQVRENYQRVVGNQPIRTIVLDASMWSTADAWDQSWPASTLSSGSQAQVTALMVDGGRADPSADISPRSSDPVGDAGRAFASALGLRDVTFTNGTAIGSTVLGQVQSQPLSVLVEQMLLTSDAALAENLGRVLAKTMGMDGSAESSGRAIMGALQQLGIESNQVSVRDASGRSDLNKVPASFVTKVLQAIHADEAGLGMLRDAMPLANRSGDLYDRFEGSPAAGVVSAVPGWIYTERSLAGLLTAADGTPLAFSFYAIKESIERDARDALDALTTAVYACGSNLSRY